MKKSKPIFVIAIIFSFCIVCAVAALAINASERINTKAMTAEQYVKEYGGNPDVYSDILALTDCTVLQEKFNQANANLNNQSAGTQQYKWSLGYMAASDDRMKDIGCYK